MRILYAGYMDLNRIQMNNYNLNKHNLLNRTQGKSICNKTVRQDTFKTKLQEVLIDLV